METRQLVIRRLQRDDLEAVAAVHLGAFSTSILTKLGKEAVYRYYRWLLEGPHETYVIGASVDGELAGFLFGGIAPDAIPGFLRDNRWLLTKSLLRRPWMVRDPLFADRLGRTLRMLAPKRAARATASPPNARKRPFDVISVAVDPRFQGEGIGKRLMGAAESLARSHGFHVMTLVVHGENHQAVGFYEALGWQKLHRGGRWSGNMELWF